MTNEEAFKDWLKHINVEITGTHLTIAEAAWNAAIAYMQEQEQEVIGYGVKLPQCMYGNIYTHKHEAEADFKSWKHIYPESKVIPLYTTPQRQQPLKRLSSGELEECWDKGKGKFTDIANAIMDEMQEINK